MQNKNFFILCSLGSSLINFRADLIKDLVNNGYNVYCGAPDSSKEIKNKIKDLGAFYVEVNINSHSLNPIYFLLDLINLFKKIRNINPICSLAYTSKPIILLGLLSLISKNMFFFPMFTGLGYYFNNYQKKILVKNILILLFKISCFKSSMCIFQNKNDYNEFLRLKIISENKKILIVNGSGVNLSNYKLKKKNISKKIVFIMVSRLLYQKGIKEFTKAAKIVKKNFTDVTFIHLGGLDNSPDKIDEADLNKWKSEGNVKFFGEVSIDKVKKLLMSSDIFVLPSYYREGIPRSSLEALASSCAILTTNNPGCDMTVINNFNGFSVNVRDHTSLAEKMLFLINNPQILKKFQYQSYELAKKFDVKKVNNLIINEINSFYDYKLREDYKI